MIVTIPARIVGNTLVLATIGGMILRLGYFGEASRVAAVISIGSHTRLRTNGSCCLLDSGGALQRSPYGRPGASALLLI